jgi:Tol biopolymer transport system component
VRSGAVTPLTKGSSMTTDNDDPVWSPNGRWIAVVRSPSRITLLSTATRRVHQLSYRGGPVDALGLAWSPDSRHLAFNHLGGIYLVDINGTHFHSLHVYGDQPSWSPDGRWIVFCYSGARLKQIRPDGSGLHLIHRATLTNERSFEPDWGRR